MLQSAYCEWFVRLQKKQNITQSYNNSLILSLIKIVELLHKVIIILDYMTVQLI